MAVDIVYRVAYLLGDSETEINDYYLIKKVFTEKEKAIKYRDKVANGKKAIVLEEKRDV